jgi:hypothetical protein
MAGIERILIRNARAYDPSRQWRGEPRDLYLAEGRVSRPFEDPDRIIEAAGRPLLAGAIDPCCLAAAPGLNLMRMLAGFPNPEQLGRLFARLGYVHLHYPFASLLTAGLVRHNLRRIPFVDTSMCVCLDLRDMGPLVRAGRPEEFIHQARALLRLTGAIGLALPFPFLRHRQRHYIQKNLTPSKVLSFLASLEDTDLQPFHLRGVPGLLDNEIPDPSRFHIAGLASALDSESDRKHAAAFLDAGGSADLGLGTGGEQIVWDNRCGVPPGGLSLDVGLQAPIRFQRVTVSSDDLRFVNGWALLAEARSDWRLSIGASAPGACQPDPLPQILSWLTRPEARPANVAAHFQRPGIDLYDWALRTRLEPARLLGLHDLGHLQEGARASLAIYALDSEVPSDQTSPTRSDTWCFIKDGIRVREGGRFTGIAPPRRMRTPELEVDLKGLEATDLFQNPTLRMENLGRPA